MTGGIWRRWSCFMLRGIAFNTRDVPSFTTTWNINLILSCLQLKPPSELTQGDRNVSKYTFWVAIEPSLIFTFFSILFSFHFPSWLIILNRKNVTQMENDRSSLHLQLIDHRSINIRVLQYFMDVVDASMNSLWDLSRERSF